MVNRIKRCLFTLCIVVASISVNATSINAAQGDIGFNSVIPMYYYLGNQTYSENLEIQYSSFQIPAIFNNIGDESWTLSARLLADEGSTDIELNLGSITPFLASGTNTTAPQTANSVQLENGETGQVVASANAGEALGVWSFTSPITISFNGPESEVIGNHTIQIYWTLTSSTGNTESTVTTINLSILYYHLPIQERSQHTMLTQITIQL